LKDLLLYILAFLVTFLLFYNNNYQNLSNLFVKNDFKYLPIPGSEIINTDSELVLIYVTSSTCPFCNDENLLAVIENIKFELKQKAEESGYSFSAIAVGIERVIQLDHF